MTDASICRDPGPVPFARSQSLANVNVKRGVHADRIAIFCCGIKQSPASNQLLATPGILLAVSEPNITEVLAANLQRFKEERGLTQAQLAQKSGLGQTTVSLYLDPSRRKDTHDGRTPAPTLANVQKLADALGIKLFELLKPETNPGRGRPATKVVGSGLRAAGKKEKGRDAK